jgi:hypothetical protein
MKHFMLAHSASASALSDCDLNLACFTALDGARIATIPTFPRCELESRLISKGEHERFCLGGGYVCRHGMEW